MTHEELMETIKDKFSFHTGKHDADIVNALYKVVELHKPWIMQTDEEGGEAVGCSCNLNIPAFLNPYPCPTIEAIEKELK